MHGQIRERLKCRHRRDVDEGSCPNHQNERMSVGGQAHGEGGANTSAG
jgi:hypothetical protein